jgi:hypothetical protein
MSWPNLNFDSKSFFAGDGGKCYGEPFIAKDYSFVELAKLTRTDASLEWQSFIPWLRQNTRMEIWLKGSTFAVVESN